LSSRLSSRRSLTTGIYAYSEDHVRHLNATERRSFLLYFRSQGAQRRSARKSLRWEPAAVEWSPQVGGRSKLACFADRKPVRCSAYTFDGRNHAQGSVTWKEGRRKNDNDPQHARPRAAAQSAERKKKKI
jgi:hypothetical protein